MKRRNRGSVLVVMLILSAMVLHASYRAIPLWRRVTERSLAKERQYRVWRLNEAIRRFEARTGDLPQDLSALEGFVPRIYEDPITGKASWVLVRNGSGRVVRVKY